MKKIFVDKKYNYFLAILVSWLQRKTKAKHKNTPSHLICLGGSTFEGKRAIKVILYLRHPLLPITETSQCCILLSTEVIYTNEQRPVHIYCSLLPLERLVFFPFMIDRDGFECVCVRTSVLHFLRNEITEFKSTYIAYTHAQRNPFDVPSIFCYASC